jgi:hypothetical protein
MSMVVSNLVAKPKVDKSKSAGTEEFLLKGGISTIDLLELTSSDQLLLLMRLYISFLQNNLSQ